MKLKVNRIYVYLASIEDLLHGCGDLGADAVSGDEGAFVYLIAVKSHTGELRGDLLTHHIRLRTMSSDQSSTLENSPRRRHARIPPKRGDHFCVTR